VLENILQKLTRQDAVDVDTGFAGQPGRLGKSEQDIRSETHAEPS